MSFSIETKEYGVPPIQICTLDEYIPILEIPCSLDFSEIAKKTIEMNFSVENPKHPRNDYIVLPMLSPAIHHRNRTTKYMSGSYSYSSFAVSFQMLRIREIECLANASIGTECKVIKHFQLSGTINSVKHNEELHKYLSVVLVRGKTYNNISFKEYGSFEVFSFIVPLPLEVTIGILAKACPEIQLESLAANHSLVEIINSKLNSPASKAYKPIFVDSLPLTDLTSTNTVAADTVCQKTITLDLD